MEHRKRQKLLAAIKLAQKKGCRIVWHGEEVWTIIKEDGSEQKVSRLRDLIFFVKNYNSHLDPRLDGMLDVILQQGKR